jgi:hypothetical protein
MKQTAVEWLAEKYNEVNWLRNRDEISSKYADELREVFLYQAKEMEKQQMKDAVLSQCTTHDGLRKIFDKQFEQYYNETYGDK